MIPLQIHLSPHRPDPAKFRPAENRPGGWGKPHGGFWTSSEPTHRDIGWAGWCEKEGFGGAGVRVAWILRPRPARVFEVHTGDDVIRLHEEYGVEAQGTAWPRRWRGLDWERIAQDYDAVRLVNPYGDDIRFNRQTTSFYGWDCESTVWLRWCFEDEMERVEVELNPREYDWE